jgi:hypothetical protein
MSPANDNLRDDIDTERWCVDFLNALRSRYAEIRDQSDHGLRGDKTMELRNLLDRVYDELGEQMSPDLRNTIATELDRPAGSNKPASEQWEQQYKKERAHADLDKRPGRIGSRRR